jgi:pilus assembly protein Flp/PilA
MTNFFKRFAQDESGATAIEYGLIAALISITIITAASQIGTGVSSRFGAVGSAVTNAPAS